MDNFMKLSREAQGMLVGTALFIILGFFDWQSYTFHGGFGSATIGLSLWHGFGTFIAIIAILLLVWEILRTLEIKIELGGVEPGVISTALAVLLGVLTIIIFIDWSQYRAWPEYLGTLLAIAVAVLAVLRARKEGVAMPAMPSNISVGGGGGAAASAAAAGAAAPAPAPEPAPLADPVPAEPSPAEDPAPDPPAEA